MNLCGRINLAVERGQLFFSHGESDAKGVLISFREAVNYKIIAQRRRQ